MPRRRFKVRELIELIEADGWYLLRQRGSHRQFAHSVKPGKVTVSGHAGDTLHPKTAASALKQARIEVED
jgi:predicted RNA binding protein YcfA (HicA-like mRNA interferase family)